MLLLFFSSEMAVKIGEKYNPDEVFLRHWHQLVTDTEVARKNIEKHLLYLSKDYLEKAHTLRESLEKEGGSSSIFGDIGSVIKKR